MRRINRVTSIPKGMGILAVKAAGQGCGYDHAEKYRRDRKTGDVGAATGFHGLSPLTGKVGFNYSLYFFGFLVLIPEQCIFVDPYSYIWFVLALNYEFRAFVNERILSSGLLLF